jgi:hypothetical protein
MMDAKPRLGVDSTPATLIARLAVQIQYRALFMLIYSHHITIPDFIFIRHIMHANSATSCLIH